MTDNYIPLTAGEAVVGKISIKDDGSFDGEFDPRYSNYFREVLEGTMVEMVIVTKPGIQIDAQQWQTQFAQFLKGMADHQRGAPCEALCSFRTLKFRRTTTNTSLERRNT